MKEPEPLDFEQMQSEFPAPWPDGTLRSQIASYVQQTHKCIVALDDDPTGTQTVHDIWVLTDWEPDFLKLALAEGDPALYILTNTRSLPLSEACAINQDIAPKIIKAITETELSVTIVSRSDSTLRGHFPGEVNALEQALISAGHPLFDGICLIPFFPEGGRYTAYDVHWVLEEKRLIPAGHTPYAKDPVFGYRNSYIPMWVQEKTEGRITASEVVTISLDMLREGGPRRVTECLMATEKGRVIVVNALSYRDLEVFTRGLIDAETGGRRYLFRTASSFVKIAAGLEDKPLLSRENMIDENALGAGLIVLGSHVPKSTSQLKAILEMKDIEAVELNVYRVLDRTTKDIEISQAAHLLETAMSNNVDSILYTSREVVVGDSYDDTLSIGQKVSRSLMEVVKKITARPKYVIGKGGITSSDLATIGLGIKKARVLGQIYPGVPVWRLSEDSRWPGMAYIVFPGNVGETDTLAEIVQMLK